MISPLSRLTLFTPKFLRPRNLLRKMILPHPFCSDLLIAMPNDLFLKIFESGAGFLCIFDRFLGSLLPNG